MTLVTRGEFKLLTRSKREIFNLLKFGLKLYLPEYGLVHMKFLKQLLNK